MKFENLPASSLPATTHSYVEQLKRMQASAPAKPTDSGVVLYMAKWCGYCTKATAYLTNKGIRYQEVDIDTRQGAQAFARAGGSGGIPLLLAGSQRVQGFSSQAYEALLGK